MNLGIRALVTELIDYAGLFPPAKLDMETAVGNYAQYQGGATAWMLGRFVAGANRLSEFRQVASSVWRDHPPNPPWRISALIGSNVQAEFDSVREFQRACHGAIIDAVELKAADADQVARAAEQVPSNVSAYFEVPIAPDPQACLAMLSARGFRAKIRTGGIQPEAFPEAATLARFIVTCAALGVPFKATAGLHHLIRNSYPLTDEVNAPVCVMHGFMNLLLAACFAHSGMAGEEVVTAILNERSARAFQFDAAGVVWGEWRLAVEQMRSARQHLLISIGSCSFEEPVNELRAMELL
jgi:hypothetical protein